MAASPHAELLEQQLEAEPFVRASLRLLEREFRELALWALVDFARSGLTSPALFDTVAMLQRPSWGTWNGLIAALRNAKKSIARTGGQQERASLENCAILDRILAVWDASAGEITEAAQSLAGILGVTATGKVRFSAALTLPITLRNAIEHGRAPEVTADPKWWETAALALRAFHVAQVSGRLFPPPPENPDWGHPWFLLESGEVWSFNGLDENLAVVYVGRPGARREIEASQDVLLTLKRLMGKTDVQEQDFRRLLAKLAPEEVKGVILGDYLVGPPAGSGGLATVHVGRQLSTGRKVAVKLLNDGLGVEERLRLRQEATYLARFNHPHIVSVIDSGQDSWHASRKFSLADEEWYRKFSTSMRVKTYIVLEWIEGETLEQVFQKRRQPNGTPSGEEVTARLLTEWFAVAAEALATVHASQLVHRDVKPSNLMVTSDGVLKLMDFGVARGDSELRTIQTATGQVVGTPAYMSPEQLRCVEAESEVGPATDIYSLCATFYELFTGRRLFDHDVERGDSVRSRKLSGGPPARPRPQAGRLSWELETILLAGLESEIPDRYESMGALHRDLEHVLRDEPIEYKRPSLIRRARLTYRRNRTVVRLVSAFLVVASLGLASYIWDIREEQQNTLRAGNRTVTALDRQYVSNGARALESNDLLAALPWFVEANRLHESRQSADDDDPARGTAHRLRLGIMFRHSPRMIGAWFHDGVIRDLQFSPDGNYLAAAGSDFKATIYDLRRGTSLELAHDDPVLRVAFSPDGTRLVTAAGDLSGRNGKGSARIWNVRTGAATTSKLEHEGNPKPEKRQGPTDYIIGHAGVVLDVTFSPDGAWVASASDSNSVRVWDAASGKLIGESIQHPDSVQFVRFSADGKRLLATVANGKAYVWDRETRAEVVPPLDHSTLRGPASFSPDGKRILLVHDDAARVFDIESQAMSEPFRDSGRVLGAAFDPSGARLVVFSDDETARIFSRREYRWLTAPLAHQGLKSVQFSPDGRELITLGGAIRLWNADKAVPLCAVLGHGDEVAARSPAGPQLAIARGGTITLWTLPNRRFEVLPGSSSSKASIAPDCDRLATLGDDYTMVRLWDVSTGRPVGVALKHRYPVGAMVFSADGRWLATVAGVHSINAPSTLGEARIWNASTGKPRAGPLTHAANVVRAVLSPDGRIVATITQEQALFLWNAETGAPLESAPPAGNPVLDVTFSPDSRRLVIARGVERPSAGTVEVWDLVRGRMCFPPLVHQGFVVRVIVSPDGRRLLSATRRWVEYTRQGESLQLWSLEVGRKLTEPIETRLPVDVLTFGEGVFSSDSTRVLINQRLLDAATGQELHTFETLAGRLRLSGDGRRILSVSEADGAARVWDTLSGEPVTPPVHHGEKLEQAWLDPRGRLVITAAERQTAGIGRSHELRVWDAKTGEPLSPVLTLQQRYTASPVAVVFDPRARFAILTSPNASPIRIDLRAEARSLEQLRDLAQMLSAGRIDATGGYVPIELETAWKRSRPASPASERQGSRMWHRREAFAAAAEGDSFAANWHLNRLLTRSSRDAALFQLRAEARLDLGSWRRAIRDATRAIELGFDARQSLRVRATANAMLQDWQSALADCQALPNIVDDAFPMVRATIYAESGHIAEAWAALAARYSNLPAQDADEIWRESLPVQVQRGNSVTANLLAAFTAPGQIQYDAECRAYLKDSADRLDARLTRAPQDELARKCRVLVQIGLAGMETVNGDRQLARELLEKAATFVGEVNEAVPDGAFLRERLALAWSELGSSAWQSSEYELAEQSFRSASVLFASISDKAPGNASLLEQAGWAYLQVGDCRLTANDPQAALELYQRGLDVATKLVRASPSDRSPLRMQSIALNCRARAQWQHGQFDAAANDLQETLNVAQAVAALLEKERPALGETMYVFDYSRSQENISTTYGQMGELALATSDQVSARGYFEKQLAIDEKLATESPHGSDEHDNVATERFRLGQLCELLEDWPAAQAHYRRAVAAKEESPDQESTMYARRIFLSDVYGRLAIVAWELAGAEAAHVEYESVLRQLQEGLDKAQNDTERAGMSNRLGWFLATVDDDRIRDGAKAIQHATNACELTRHENPDTLDTLAAAFACAGQFDEAVKWEKQAVELAATADPESLEDYQAHLQQFEAKQPVRER